MSYQLRAKFEGQFIVLNYQYLDSMEWVLFLDVITYDVSLLFFIVCSKFSLIGHGDVFSHLGGLSSHSNLLY